VEKKNLRKREEGEKKRHAWPVWTASTPLLGSFLRYSGALRTKFREGGEKRGGREKHRKGKRRKGGRSNTD